MLRCDDWLIGTDVSEQCCVSIFRSDSLSRDQELYVWFTVHLGMILVNNQLDAQFFMDN